MKKPEIQKVPGTEGQKAPKPETIEIYRQRVEAAVAYIDLHLDEELDLSDIAAVAHFSPFHFHRIFKAFRGEPPGGYITRRRVETAARLLRGSDLPVETIAYRVGFEVPASLNKAFRNYYDTTPGEYRSTKNRYLMKTTQISPAVKLPEPEMVELSPQNVICLSFTGEYGTIDFGGAFARLWNEVKAQNLFTEGIDHIGVYYDDPKSTDPARLRTDVCLVVHKPAVAAGDVQVKTISGGRYAVFTHTGRYDEVGAFYDAIFGEWVPANCECEDCKCGGNCVCALRDEPVFEKYLNDPTKTAPEKLKTEIYIPIK
jgi:AraC family transcriptional regulator